MSVVSHQTRWRWAVVVVGVAVIASAPAVASAAVSWTAGDTKPTSNASPRALLARAKASDDVPYSGLATSRGNLGLPDLPSVADATAALGGTTRSRVWWANSGQWRVSVVTATGEQGIYGRGGATYLWDYEDSSLTRVEGVPTLRLPRPDDLLPPQATRRLLAGVGPDDVVSALPGTRRIAGQQAQGIRIRPGDQRSTIGAIDIWLDPVHALPIGLRISGANGVTALESQFDDLDLAAPPSSVLAVPHADGMTLDDTPAPDLASRINRFGRVQLPNRLAGFDASAPVVGGTGSYGDGLVRFVVLPVSRRNANGWFDAARSGATRLDTLDGGDTVLIRSGAVNLVVARSSTGQTYAIAGPVDEQILQQAAQSLFTHPPEFRRGPIPGQ